MNFTFHILFSDLFITWFVFFPLICITILYLVISFLLFYSLWNIFKIFFFTESLLLLCVIFLTQTSSLFFEDSALYLFYCQIILAAAAAEAALFLGLFSHLYEQQFTTRVPKKKNLQHLFKKKDVLKK